MAEKEGKKKEKGLPSTLIASFFKILS